MHAPTQIRTLAVGLHTVWNLSYLFDTTHVQSFLILNLLSTVSLCTPQSLYLVKQDFLNIFLYSTVVISVILNLWHITSVNLSDILMYLVYLLN